MSIFKRGTVYSLILAVKGRSLKEGDTPEAEAVAAVEELKDLFEETYILNTPNLPVGQNAYLIPSGRSPKVCGETMRTRSKVYV